MIVWGGEGYSGCLNDGGRYNPAADSWTALPTSGAPAGRFYHTAVWTGSEMIIWAGVAGTSPATRISTTAGATIRRPTVGRPCRPPARLAARGYHTAVWTGSEMIVWGGWDRYVGCFNDGGRYNPTANSWTAVSSPGAPAARYLHTAVWTGSEMIVFGGQGNSGYLSDAWSYYPYAPAVRISRSSSTSAVVAWPVWSSTPLRLCQTTNPASGQWTTVTNVATQVGPENHVTVSPLSGGLFFRAAYP